MFYFLGFTNDNGLPHYISRIPDDAFTKKNQVHPLEAEWTKKHDPAEYENMKLAAEKKSYELLIFLEQNSLFIFLFL